MREVAKVWRPGVSKVQYRMNLIDGTGANCCRRSRNFRRRTILRSSAVHISDDGVHNTSGVGQCLFPGFRAESLRDGPSTMRWSDDVLLTLAPILGDVLTIRKPLARYRIHAANNSALRSLDAEKIRSQLRQDTEKAALFVSVSRQMKLAVPRDPLRYSLNHLQYRFASYLVDPASHPFPAETLLSLLSRLVYSITASSQVRLRDKVILLTWGIACALAPPYLRRNLVEWRFAPLSRPQALKALLRAPSSLRSSRLPNRAGAAPGQ